MLISSQNYVNRIVIVTALLFALAACTAAPAATLPPTVPLPADLSGANISMAIVESEDLDGVDLSGAL